MARRSSITPRDLECMLCDETAEPKALPLSLLEEITDGFSVEQQIGKGGFAVVYKGKLENRTVAVKRMSDMFMHEKVFHREIECLMMAKHKNIVRFLGYCADRQGSMERYNGKLVMADVHQRLLCFEYLPRGSLHEYITDTSCGLHWRDRYQIITGVCEGLHYLHEENIVHLDLKPANILLDDNLAPKIADFGLSRCYADMQSRLITMIGGTFGYMAPEFCTQAEIKYRHSYRLDIYSLGVIIIEILTGKKGYHDVDKVVESWRNKLEKSEHNVQLEQIRVCAEIGIECTDFNPTKRPNTQNIISRLEETNSMDGYIKTSVLTSQKDEDAPSEVHQDMPSTPGEISSEGKNASNELHPNMPNTPGETSFEVDNNSKTAQMAQRTTHRFIECDGCEVCPIVGPRYNSKVKEDYDLCDTCFRRMGSEVEYTRIDREILPPGSRLPYPQERQHLRRKSRGSLRKSMGAQENDTAQDFHLSAISRPNLNEGVEKVESTVSQVMMSPLLGIVSSASKSTLNRPRVLSHFWETKKSALNDFWLLYQQLNPDIRRCFEYCNIFPRRFKLKKDKLVHLWIAQGFVKTSCATEEMEDVAEGYIQELVSCLFLQPNVEDYSKEEYFTIHDLLHDLLDKVAGSDCFRIENGIGHTGESWKGVVPRDVRHLFVQNYHEELISEKILGLENLRTLIIYVVESGTQVEKKVIESICKRLSKLRVLAIPFSQEHDPIEQPNKLSIPESIVQLKHLCYLAFRTSWSCTVILPSALTKLDHIQVLDFGNGQFSGFTSAGLINLRHIFCDLPNNIGRLISLRTLPRYGVRNEHGYEMKQLRDLNKLRGNLVIKDLENVKSKEEALEANLGAKERLTSLELHWDPDRLPWDREDYDYDDSRCSPEVEAEVLEGLCPPVSLQELKIVGYQGSRYPDWMEGQQNGGPKDLQKLVLYDCDQVCEAAPTLEAFPHLRVLHLVDSRLPYMKHLTSLKELHISGCSNIQELPTLPRSLEKFNVERCSADFVESCETKGHPNWQEIKHIKEKNFRTW